MLLEHIHQFNLEVNQHDKWIGKPFEELARMKSDSRGKYGEILFSLIIHHLKWNIELDTSDKNQHEDGTYDIKANNKRIEVKTACYSNSFQHEPLYTEEENKCDIVVFFDFYYDKFYISIVKTNELPLNKTNKFLFNGLHGHLRPTKKDGYKLDFSLTTLKTLEKAKRCKTFSSDVTLEEMASFVEEVFNDLL